MSDQTAELGKLLTLFNFEKKKDVEKYCRDAVFASLALSDIILAASDGGLETYRYKSHFAELSPPHLEMTDVDLRALGMSRVGTLDDDARTAARKVSQMFVDRKLFAAHMFYTPNHDLWHLIYFTQRDIDRRSNHWVAGAHIHYSRESYANKPLKQVWADVCDDPPKPPRGEHIRYVENEHRK
jgi:hypothetical protein